jgi:hypothetical protein
MIPIVQSRIEERCQDALDEICRDPPIRLQIRFIRWPIDIDANPLTRIIHEAL